MAYEIEIQDVLEYLRDCITEEWKEDESGFGGGQFITKLTYEGKEIVSLLRYMNKIYDERGYSEQR